MGIMPFVKHLSYLVNGQWGNAASRTLHAASKCQIQLKA